jgi:uncharacterized membrane protein YciS (DUF1049 family)
VEEAMSADSELVARGCFKLSTWVAVAVAAAYLTGWVAVAVVVALVACRMLFTLMVRSAE